MGVFPGNRAEHAECGGDGVAAAFDGKLDDIFRVEVDRLRREARAGGMLDALVHRKDRHVPGACEATVILDRVEIAQDGRCSIAERDHPIDKIRTREMQERLVKTLSFVREQIIRVGAEKFR